MEEEKKETKKDNIQHKIKEQTEKKINDILTQGVQAGNIDMLYKLVDIHKDMANEEYWKNKEEVMEMNYREYGNYEEDRYNEGSYGRRGVPGSGRGRRRYSARGNYRGHEVLEDMYNNYGEYSDAREEYSRGNYGAKQGTMKSLEYMLESVVEFVEMLKEDASSQEEVQLIKKYTKQISEM